MDTFSLFSQSMEDIKWNIKYFNDITTREFHDIIKLRETVFVLEQNCVYLDVDGKDTDCYHAYAQNENNEVIATLRILKAGNYYNEVAIGRVCITESHRGNQLARKLMNMSIQFISKELNTDKIRISAQTYLKSFYESLGFKPVGEEYLEDGIPHIEMAT